jgi:hypothetical protein
MLGRKSAEKLVTAYGGKLSKSLSKNTSYDMVGNDAGPKKLEQIDELGIETLNESGLIKMLERSGVGNGDGGERMKRGAEGGGKALRVRNGRYDWRRWNTLYIALFNADDGFSYATNLVVDGFIFMSIMALIF